MRVVRISGRMGQVESRALICHAVCHMICWSEALGMVMVLCVILWSGGGVVCYSVKLRVRFCVLYLGVGVGSA